MTKQERDTLYREKMAAKGYKIHSYWMPISIIEEVRLFIKSREKKLNKS